MTDQFTQIDAYTRREGTQNIYSNGLVESVINEGAYIDVSYLLEGKTRIEQNLKGKKAYILNDSVGYFRISKEARQLSASKEYSGFIAATALIINNTALRLVLDLYFSIDKPTTLTKAFTKKEDALKWLLEQMEKR
jgi:hypothetical protein